MSTKKQPYKIEDKKNLLAYNSVILGLLKQDHELVRQGVEAGANLEKIKVSLNDFDQDWNEMDRDSKMVSVEEYTKTNGNGLIYNEVIKNLKQYNKFKPMAVMKVLYSFMENREYRDYNEVIDFSEGLQVLKEYITSKNVNTPIEIYSYRNPFEGRYDSKKKIQTSLLNYACYTLNVEAVKYLLSIGADPNYTVKSHEYRGASIISTIKGTPPKGDQSAGVEILKILVDNKANLNLVNNSGETGWEAAVSKFKIPQLKTIFKDHQPQDLAVIEKIKSKSYNLYLYWNKKSPGFTKYPLINDILKYENRAIDLGRGFNEIPGVEKFFKFKSIKDALKHRYGIDSKQFTATFTEKLFQRENNDDGTPRSVHISPKCFISADILKDIYFNKKQQNQSDFIEVYKQLEVSEDFGIDDTSKYSTQGKKLAKFLVENFQTPQIKEILTNKEELNKDKYRRKFDETSDILDMFFRHEDSFRKIMEKMAFRQLNSLEKIHDALSAEIEVLDQENYKLNQEKHYPTLVDVSKIEMPEKYGVQVAQENHELIRWGAMMGHCIGGGSYAESAAKGENILLCITHDDLPKYAIEIADGELLQVQGKSHTVPPKEVLTPFIKGLQALKILDKKQKAKDWEN